MWKWLVFPPWQCSCALNAVHQGIFHEDQDSSVGTATLQPDLSLLVPQLCCSLISLHWYYNHHKAWSHTHGSTAILQPGLSPLVLQPPYSLMSLQWFHSQPTAWTLSCGSTATLLLWSPVVSQALCSLISLQWSHSQPTASLCSTLFLFPKLRCSLGGHQFESEEDTQEKSQEQLTQILS